MTHTVHVTQHGQGLPVVLLHGWGFDQTIWHTTLSWWSESYQVYLVDLPGFGLTPSMTWEAFKASVLSQLPDKFSLVGWSMGGLWATRLALEEPLRVQCLMNVASSPCFIQDDHWPGVSATVFQSFYQSLCRSPEKTLRRFIALQAPMLDFELTTPTHEGLRVGLEILLTWDFRAQLARLSMPVCYVFGARDTITPSALKVVMQQQYPAFATHQLDSAAHAPFLSHPEHFFTVVKNFLGQV